MKKEYRHKGVCPVIVNGHGRVNPGTKSFICEMDEAQEEFFLRIGAIEVTREVPDDTPNTKPSMPKSPSSAFWPAECPDATPPVPVQG